MSSNVTTPQQKTIHEMDVSDPAGGVDFSAQKTVATSMAAKRLIQAA